MSKILIAEDDKFLASAYKVKLTKVGHEVMVVSDGQQLLDALPTFIPNLIILDLVMPVMDGFTALQKIKLDERWKLIPVIVASNLGQSEDVVKATKLGANDYLVKTDLSMKKLTKKINTIIKSVTAVHQTAKNVAPVPAPTRNTLSK